MEFAPQVSSVSGIISLVILGLFALTMLSSVVFGLIRGFGKALLRFITVAFSFIVALMVATLALDKLSGYWEGMTLLELINNLNVTLSGAIPEFTPETEALIASFDVDTIEPIVNLLGAVIILPITFVIIFFLLKIVTWIVYFILGGILSIMKKEKSALSRLLGGAIGAVQGLLIFAVVMVPISGYVSMVKDLREPLTAEGMPDDVVDMVDQAYDVALSSLTEDPVINFFSALGSRAMFTSISTVKMDGEKVDMSGELKSLLNIYIDSIPIQDMDFMAPTEQDKEDMSALVDSALEDRFLSTVLSGLLRGVSCAFDKGALMLPLEEPFATLGMDLISVFRDSTPDNLDDDITTVLNVYFILAEHQVFDAVNGEGEDIAKALITEINGERCVDRVVAELKANPHTKHLVSSITKLSVSVLTSAMGEEAAELYENVKAGISDVLSVSKDGKTEEEYKAEVSEKLDTTLKDNGIEVEEEILNSMVDFVNENSDQLSNIAEEDLDTVILSYFDAYAKYMAENPDGTPDDFLDDLGGGSQLPVTVITYEEFMAADVGAICTVETNLQAWQSLKDGRITLYLQDNEGGAYYVSDMPCTPEIASTLTKGARIMVTGEKTVNNGHIQISGNVRIEPVAGGSKYTAPTFDLTDCPYGVEFVSYMNKRVSFKGITVLAVDFADGAVSAGESDDDIYVLVRLTDGTELYFCVERDLTCPETELYQVCGHLQVGQLVDLDGFLCWSEDACLHITDCDIVG